jgi:hypothetical protein
MKDIFMGLNRWWKSMQKDKSKRDESDAIKEAKENMNTKDIQDEMGDLL